MQKIVIKQIHRPEAIIVKQEPCAHTISKHYKRSLNVLNQDISARKHVVQCISTLDSRQVVQVVYFGIPFHVHSPNYALNL
jgi:hypothetical protein